MTMDKLLKLRNELIAHIDKQLDNLCGFRPALWVRVGD